MSLPLLISLFLAALVGVFPAATPVTPAPAAVTFAVDRSVPPAGTAPTRTAPARTAPADRTAAVTTPVTDPPAAPAAAEPAPGLHPAVRVLAGQDVHPASAPRAPPLHLV